MNIKPGLCELVVTASLCAICVTNGESWAAGLVLSACLQVIACMPVLVLNYRGLPARFRVDLLNCALLPYSAFLVILPRALMLPAADQLLSEPGSPGDSE